MLSASKMTASFPIIRNCRSSFTAARSRSRTTSIRRRYLKSCLAATAGEILGTTAFTITHTITREPTKCSVLRAVMPGFVSAVNAEKSFASRPAMLWSCPAGTGHQRLAASKDLLVVGAYPPFGSYDECRACAADHDRALTTIPKVALPRKDPVYGRDGPLTRLWRRS